MLMTGVIFLTSCSVTRNLRDDQYLLRKNVISFSDKNPGIDADEVYTIAQPKPNPKFLGILPVKLYFYNMGLKGKQESGFRVWLREKVGSRPVLYEASLAEKSVESIENYLDKTGFFHSGVKYEAFLKKKKAKVVYTITPSLPYRYRNIKLPAGDTIISELIRSTLDLSKIDSGMIFNAFALDDERERITEVLQNNGYYNFDRNYIYFEIDSSLKTHQLDLWIKIKNFDGSTTKDTSTLHISHYRYKINDIYVKTNYDEMIRMEGDLDTLLFTVDPIKGDNPSSSYYFVFKDEMRVSPLTLTQSIFMKPGITYSAKDVKKSKMRLSEIGVYGYTNIRFKEVSQGDSTSFGELDCFVDLGRRKLHAFTVEAEGTNRGGRPGIGLNVAYQNNNIFRGSETLQMKAKIALEAQKNAGSSSNESGEDIPFFNTVETGLEMAIIFPRFLIPIKQQRFPKYFRPKTTIRAGFGYDRRPEYTRSPVYLVFGYDWKESEYKRHIINPFDWNIVQVDLSPGFQEEIDNEPNDRIRNQYTDNLILALTYSFIFNNQDINKLKNFTYFRGNVESGGNFLYAGYTLFGSKPDSVDYYTMNDIRFSQYFRIDGDFRFYNVITRNNTLVYRIYAGIGIPYGNAEVLPLEKGFYGGGANGMRGWPLRLLGPGSYSNPEDNFDRMGDLQLEANLEYRMPVYKFFKLGLFVDIGNIWLLKENESYLGGEFRFDKFYKDFAIDAGLGLRLDFDFFILRIDGAIPFRDPALPAGNMWTFSNWQFKDILFNFGIGYPF
jgi:outer membrane protein assembly factor BamA